MLRGKLQKQLLTQHLKLCRAVLQRCPAFPANGAAVRLQGAFPFAGKATMKAKIKDQLGHWKTEKMLLFNLFWGNGQTSVTPFNTGNSFAQQNSPSHAERHGFRMIIYIIYKDRRWSLTASWPDALGKSMHPWDWSSAASWTKRGSLFSL